MPSQSHHSTNSPQIRPTLPTSPPNTRTTLRHSPLKYAHTNRPRPPLPTHRPRPPLHDTRVFAALRDTPSDPFSAVAPCPQRMTLPTTRKPSTITPRHPRQTRTPLHPTHMPSPHSATLPHDAHAHARHSVTLPMAHTPSKPTCVSTFRSVAAMSGRFMRFCERHGKSSRYFTIMLSRVHDIRHAWHVQSVQSFTILQH